MCFCISLSYSQRKAKKAHKIRRHRAKLFVVNVKNLLQPAHTLTYMDNIAEEMELTMENKKKTKKRRNQRARWMKERRLDTNKLESA